MVEYGYQIASQLEVFAQAASSSQIRIPSWGFLLSKPQ
jgi:hypothetical protein